jgi:circadian clock protein KaiC
MKKAKSIDKIRPPKTTQLPKTKTGIFGFDDISFGGLPKGRSTLISGSSGSGKTIFATQFLYEGIAQFDEPGVFVTFEENTADLKRNVQSFGWDIQRLENENQWRFIDASIAFENETKVVGEYDLEGLMIRIHDAVKEIKA